MDWAVLASFSTLVAALGTLWTVKEMRRASITSLQPDLIPLETNIDVDGQTEKTNLNYKWYNGKIKSGEKTSFGISIVNIGLGSAKNIKVKWQFEPQVVLREAKSNGSSHRFKVSGNFIGNETSSFNCKAYLDQVYNACLTINNSSTGIEVLVPMLPIFLTNEIIFSSLEENSVDRLDLQSDRISNLFGANKFLIEYMDIQNNHYKKKFEVKMNLLVVNENSFRGYLNVNEL